MMRESERLDGKPSRADEVTDVSGVCGLMLTLMVDALTQRRYQEARELVDLYGLLVQS